ncbi:hypothetical protein LC085_07590 [Bacillus tianshenii]|uniref:hypothetical protein n=1 Tax=Sutcliffiella tianshenii TaxID=1463404 RepID=UPI001CD7CC07|nr:hypothetical protein [Bacillus tianshenii]MCA1319774.1 hypothetical protein [Bacillus tianshenii]
MRNFNSKPYEEMNINELIEELESRDDEIEELREELARSERSVFDYKKKAKERDYEGLFPTNKNLYEK